MRKSFQLVISYTFFQLNKGFKKASYPGEMFFESQISILSDVLLLNLRVLLENDHNSCPNVTFLPQNMTFSNETSKNNILTFWILGIQALKVRNKGAQKQI